MNMNMKYALILFVGLSMAASGAFAQERPARDRLEEIEQLTGCSADSIRKNLSRARKKIREDYIRLNERRKPR